MRRLPIAALCIACVLVLASACKKKPNYNLTEGKPCSAEKYWNSGGGLGEIGETPEGIFALTFDLDTLHVWKWVGSDLQLQSSERVPPLVNVSVWKDNIYLAHRDADPNDEYSPWCFELASTLPKRTIRTWEEPKGWNFSKTAISRNGKYAAVLVDIDVAKSLDEDVRLSIWELPGGSPCVTKWIRDSGSITEVTVSNDGKYGAIIGIANGVAVFETSSGNLLWCSRPPSAGSCNAGRFTADGASMVVGDSEGKVYELDSRSGRVKKTWDLAGSEAGTMEARIECISLSPDDKWIGVMARPLGQAFLISREQDKRPVVLKHGRGLWIVAFSPDSTTLATAGDGKIKFWKVSEQFPDSFPPTRQDTTKPASSGAETRGN